jgi:hypothetical protein
MKTMHLLTGEYGLDAGGVGAYCQLLAEAMVRRGLRVHVWDTLDSSLKEALPAALKSEPGYVLLQYVPNALGASGSNIGFCQWFLSLRRDGADVRVMFHEPYFYLSWNPVLTALSMVQRLMAGILLRASTRTYISTERWRQYLDSYAPPGTAFTVLPIPSTLPDEAAPESVSIWRARFGGDRNPVVVHFGTYGDHVATDLAPILPVLLERIPGLQFAGVGRGSEAFVRRVSNEHSALAPRLHATGSLDRAEAAAAIAAGDLALQPYPDGVTTRRTSVMAPLSLGVATVTSTGFLTEDAWRQTPSVALAKASDTNAHVAAAVALLRDASTRQQLASLGRRFYRERFAIAHTVEILARDAPA